jgi:class 3 adenylate cyclase
MSIPERNLCVLCASVAGDTRLQEKLGIAEALHAVERCMTRMERAVAIHGGRLLKAADNQLTAVFPTAAAALLAACEMERRIDDLPPVSGINLSVRIGIHFGPGVPADLVVDGEVPKLAARLKGAAGAGQIVVSGDTVAALPPSILPLARRIEEALLGSTDAAVTLFEVDWRQLPKPVLNPPATPVSASKVRLVLRHAGVEIPIDHARDALSLGRDPSNDYVVGDRRASRIHCRIERRGGTYVLVDISSNGTYVTFHGETEIALRRESIPLRGHGHIAFGHSCTEISTEAVEFFLSE